MTTASSPEYKRIVIVDPQLKDQLGHNYRYVQGIASSCPAQVTVVCHDSYLGKEDDVAFRPCLSFDQYNNSAFKEGFKIAFYQRLMSLKQRLTRRLSSNNSIWPKDSPLAQAVTFMLWVFGGLMFVPALLQQLYALVRGLGTSAHKDLAAQELRDAFADIGLGKGDLVIFQTMLWPTFESLLELRVQLSGAYECDALFIVHEDWLIYNTLYSRFSPSSLRKRVLESLPFERVKLVATNQPLIDYCNRWGGYAPALIKELESSSIQVPQRSLATINKFKILVPGVYRGDKNFDSLPDLLARIAEQHPAAEFCLHESVLAQIALPARLGDRCRVYQNIDGAQAWLEFLAAHSLILIPYAEAYRHRISGMIHEARQINIPVVCNKDIADASLINDSRSLFGDGGEGVAEAVGFCQQAALGHQHFIEQYPLGLLEHIEQSEGWIEVKDKPVAVQVKPAWTRCGTSVVLDAQLDYLVERDYFVIEIYLKSEPWQATAEQVEFMWQVMRGGREFSGGMLSRVLLKEVKLLPLLSYLTQLYRHNIPAFYKRENIHHTWCVPDAALRRFMDKQGVELALVNHMFHTDFARQYIPARHYICETHDIQINQLLLRRPELKNNYDNELRYELDVLAGFDAVVNLNQAEHQLIKNRVGEASFYIQPPIIDRGVTRAYLSLAALIEEESAYSASNTLPEQFDLLIVGDSHPSNIDSVNQFIDTVFTQLPAGTTLGLVGKVASHLEEPLAELPGIYPIGFVQDLANLYDFSRLVILPDTGGEGIAIKAFEPIAKGQLFVATDHAMRGFSAEQVEKLQPWICADHSDMLTQITGLLSGQYDVAGFEQSCSAVLADFSCEHYHMQWDRVLDITVSTGAGVN